MTVPGSQSVAELPAGLVRVVDDLYGKSGAAEFAISRDQFARILQHIAGKYLPTGSSAQETTQFWSGLKLEELALARACAAGHERAWEVFMARYREKLYDVAAYITKESSAARELADSLYADLYGTGARDGQRVSKLSSYTGRGSLEGWLRTVMAQEHINRYRRQRRMVSLDEESDEGKQFAAPTTEVPAPVDSKVERAIDEVLGGLPADERFMLASYFLDGRTLAEIARTLSVHESTISRKLNKLTKSLRKNILGALTQSGMSRRQAEEALEVDVRDLRVNIRSGLAQESGPQSFPEKEAEAPAGDGSG